MIGIDKRVQVFANIGWNQLFRRRALQRGESQPPVTISIHQEIYRTIA